MNTSELFLRTHLWGVSFNHPFSFFSTPNKKKREKKEKEWVMDTREFCLRTNLGEFGLFRYKSIKKKKKSKLQRAKFSNNVNSV